MIDAARRDGTAHHDASMEAMARHLYGDGDMDEERRIVTMLDRMEFGSPRRNTLASKAAALIRQQHDRIISLLSLRSADAMELLVAHGESQAALEEAARLTAERDAAEERGAERMRERAAQIAMAAHEMWWRRSIPTAFRACDEVAQTIRALPLRDTSAPDSSGEDEANG